MRSKPSNELKIYLAENIIDFIQGQTGGKDVSSEQIKKLQEGVSNICLAGYPDDTNAINTHAPKLVRAGLDSSQLPWADAAIKIVDPINPPKNDVVAGILNNIALIKEGKGPEQFAQQLGGRLVGKGSAKNHEQQRG